MAVDVFPPSFILFIPLHEKTSKQAFTQTQNRVLKIKGWIDILSIWRIVKPLLDKLYCNPSPWNFLHEIV